MVVLVLRDIADEGELAKTWFIELDQRTDVTEGHEECGQLLIGVIFRVVLDVQIVVQFSGIGSVSGVPSDSEAFLAVSRFLEHSGGLFSVFFVFVADEAIATG